MHFAEDPGLAWGFYGHRLGLYRATVPHVGFGVLRDWALPTRVFTSNVDGQFQSAGGSPGAEWASPPPRPPTSGPWTPLGNRSPR